MCYGTLNEMENAFLLVVDIITHYHTISMIQSEICTHILGTASRELFSGNILGGFQETHRPMVE